MAEIRIGCGTTTTYTDALGRVWAADNSFSGGATFTIANSIANTSDQTIFQSERSAIAKAYFFYSISIPNGTYTLKLGFAEIGFNFVG